LHQVSNEEAQAIYEYASHAIPVNEQIGRIVRYHHLRIQALEKDLEAIAEKVAAKMGAKETTINEGLKVELEASKNLQSEAESKAKVAEELQTKVANDLAKANKVIEGFKKAAPGVDLLAMLPVLMPVTEHIAVLERLVPSVMVERSTMGMQVQGQKVRAELLKAKEKLRVK
jgi:hypothetical protein